MIATQNPIIDPFQLPEPDLPPGVTQETADEVLDHYLANPAIVMADIASLCEVPVRVVGRILDSDYGRSIIELIERLSDRRAAIFASEARIQAIATTKRLARESRNDETARRAAAALLRFKTYTPSSSKEAASPSEPNAAPSATRQRPAGTSDSPGRDDHSPSAKPLTTPGALLFPLRQNSTTTRVPRAACPPVMSPNSAPAPTRPAAPAPALRVPPPAAQPRVVTDTPSTSTTAPAPSPAPIPSAASLTSPHLTYTPNPPARASPA